MSPQDLQFEVTESLAAQGTVSLQARAPGS